MAKYGLLIGASEYQSNKLKPLPGVVQDIKSMQRILQDPNIGGFAEVKLLENTPSSTIQLEIEQLFTETCQKNDILLLYFSGHGFRDENGYLYFASYNTQINAHSLPYTSTAVPARFLQEQCMNRSKSKRQVLILDCCFSGAFAQGMSAREILPSIDKEIEQQLGGEGRAVLTSSTSAQVSFEDEGGGVYTRYLVEGIEKGVAADNDGMITVATLHEYAKRKVQSAQPAMKPEIFSVKEGYTICLAKAPVGDPELEYRKEVEECVKKGAFLVQDDRFSALGRRLLDRKQKQLNLAPPEKVTQIEQEVLQPIRDFQQSLREYEQDLALVLEEKSVLNKNDWELLKRIQQILKLRDEDVTPIHERLIPQQPPKPQPLQPNTPPSQIDDLSSEKGIDYTKLRDLLAAQKWKEADYETYMVMLQAVGRKENDWIRAEELLNFPCADLRTIDSLWVKYSNGRYGFSVQKKIYLQEGGKPDGKYYEEAWKKFGDRVGWRVKGNWISDDKVTFDTQSPEGHLPSLRGSTFVWVGLGWGGGFGAGFFWGGLVSSLASRLVKCSI
ncbi:GUN4 domain-containing protein [Aetokthonos hydrillicola Thurmond2011]|jgi:hypothetical protein|uniref:GUN4 domain-containing protein n=2 Tax=Aetokthonos TaxID=1550243 RepID=A0AAP5I9P6_9CYAN|nr:GUN4 domain-containing protein [Aetokthonos hydrillicola]MBW4585519.1 GUN4 domain-containing protein [Aetokthonos hydrillicola CCALA 1050]MDR9896142.1 GUN4 domain-containing protein [Aetokthonos hydrillicola Thurmond2011]